MKLINLLLFVGLWKLKENSKNYIVNMLNTGKICAFEENNNKNVLTGYWEQENNELSIVTNQSKTYLAVCSDVNSSKIEGYVGYGIDYPDYLYNFELIPIYRNKTVNYEQPKLFKPVSSFVGKWLLEIPFTTSHTSVKKIKIRNKRTYKQINNRETHNFPIVNLINLDNNGTWYYGTLNGHLHRAGTWNVYNYSTHINYNNAYNLAKKGENIYLKQTNNIVFLGTTIASNNSKINGTTIEGVIDPDYTSGVKITRWYI